VLLPVYIYIYIYLPLEWVHFFSLFICSLLVSVLYMNISPLTEYYMKGIVSYFECMNEYGFMQRYYINGRGGLRER